MKKIYLIQMYSSTVPSRIIKKFTSYPYSHVGISFDENCDTFYSFGRRKPKSIIGGGFVIQRSTDEFFKRFSKTKCRILELDVTDEQYEKLEGQIGGMILRYDDLKYDYGGFLIRWAFHIPVSFRNRYVCSQFVSEMLLNAGICDLGKKTCFARPGDFDKIKGTSEVYKGMYPKAKALE